MRKLKMLITLFAVVLITNSCEKEKNDVKAYVKIEVKEDGIAKSDLTVYMFTEQTGPGTIFFKPFHSRKSVLTDNEGIATFKLNETFGFNPVTNQTTLYYGVFGQNDVVLGSVEVIIKKGETKEATISM